MRQSKISAHFVAGFFAVLALFGVVRRGFGAGVGGVLVLAVWFASGVGVGVVCVVSVWVWCFGSCFFGVVVRCGAGVGAGGSVGHKRSILPAVMLNLFQHLAVNAVDKILSYPNAFIGYLLLFCRTANRWGFPITTLGNDRTYNDFTTDPETSSG